MPITLELVVFALTVFGAIAGLWWRVEAKIDGARQKAEGVEKEFLAYQRHVAETYITKDGLREMLGQMMSGIADLKQQISHISTRVDSLVDQQRPPRRKSGESE